MIVPTALQRFSARGCPKILLTAAAVIGGVSASVAAEPPNL